MKGNYFIRCFFLCFFFIGYFHFGYAQQKAVIDSSYLEDQLYLSVAYTFLTQKTSGVSQSGLSSEISTGFIKDIPLNKKRDFALGIGLGYAYNLYNSNLKITSNNIDIADSYDTNLLHTSWVEIPFEIRWRNSTPTKYSFFRFYAGVKFSYLFYSKSLFEDERETISLRNNSQINKFQYGLHFAIGYGSLNLYALYNLHPLFKKKSNIVNQSNTSQLTIGIKFYML